MCAEAQASTVFQAWSPLCRLLGWQCMVLLYPGILLAVAPALQSLQHLSMCVLKGAQPKKSGTKVGSSHAHLGHNQLFCSAGPAGTSETGCEHGTTPNVWVRSLQALL